MFSELSLKWTLTFSDYIVANIIERLGSQCYLYIILSFAYNSKLQEVAIACLLIVRFI